MNTSTYSDAKPITPNFAKLIEKAAVLSPVIQEEIILQWFEDIENDTATTAQNVRTASCVTQ